MTPEEPPADAFARYAHIRVTVQHIGSPSPAAIVDALEAASQEQNKEAERPAA